MRINQKRLLLVGLVTAFLIVMLFIIVSCLIKPDRTIDNVPIDPSNAVLPFQVATPTPTPEAPSETGGQENLETWSSAPPAVITPAPSAIPTMTIITASPRPEPTWTPTPSPTSTAKPKATATKPPDDGTLRNGSTGQNVRNLQQKLKNLGFYSGSVDGDFGDGTESALRDFQRANGLTVDGIAGSRTLSALNSGNAKGKASASKNATSRPALKEYTPSTLSTYRYLQLGSSGSDVIRLQNRLKELGYFSGAVNGNYGSDTEAAVLAFQKRNGLWADAVAGEDTQRMLFSSTALANGG